MNELSGEFAIYWCFKVVSNSKYVYEDSQAYLYWLNFKIRQVS